MIADWSNNVINSLVNTWDQTGRGQKLLIINQMNLVDHYGIQQLQLQTRQKSIKVANQQIFTAALIKNVHNSQYDDIQLKIITNQLQLRGPHFRKTAKLTFWTIFEPLCYQNSPYQFCIRINDSQSYNLSVYNLQQFNKIKSKFIKSSIIKSFYKDYKPIRKLGEGKSAAVFFAKDRQTGESVAVKAFSKQQMKNDPKSMLALENQVTILRNLNSSHLIHLKAFYETEKSYYMVTNYVEGRTLKNMIQTEELSYCQIIHIFKQLLKGINYLSGHNIAHRDLKPDNILIQTSTNNVIIVDFGLSVMCSSVQQHLYKRCGTPGFIAPQILGKQYSVTPKADIFSLGITLYLMLMKKFPYRSMNPENILNQNQQAKFDWSSLEYSHLPQQAIYLLNKTLQKEQSKRLSASELLHYLDQREVCRTSSLTVYKAIIQRTKNILNRQF